MAVIADNACSSSTSATFQSYTAGTTLTLVAATRACFRATDSVNNVRYVSSAPGADLVDTSVVTLDTTAPVITVTPAAADSAPKRQIRVFASSSSSDADAGSWQRKIISSSDICNAAEMNSGTSSGRSVTLNSESYNNRKVCFAVKDTSDNWNYAASGLITGIDRTAPVITVTPAAADSAPKRQITVVASSSAADADGNSWERKIISSSDTCNAAEMSSGTSSGGSVILNSESYNSRKVCFGVKDTVDNWNYAASGLITGIDRTAPSIAVSSVSADNEVDALVSDNSDNSPILRSQIIGDNVCDGSIGASFEAYSAGSALSLPVGSRACFEATDSANNVSYATSGVGVDPEIMVPANDVALPTINISTVGSNRVSASLTGNLDNSPVLEVLIISDAVCGPSTDGTFKVYITGTDLTLPVGSRACFRVTDDAQRTAYALSAAGKQKKKRIIEQEDSQSPSPRLEVTVFTGDALSATDNYPAATTMYYRIQSDDGCDSNFEGAFSIYQEGTALNPTVGDDYYVCFKSVDNDDSSNVAYSISALIAVDEPEPQQPAAPVADEPLDVAVDTDPSPSTPEPGSNVDPDPVDSDDGSDGDPTDNNDNNDDDAETDPSSTPNSDSDNNIAFLLILLGAGLLAAALIVIIVKKDLLLKSFK